MRRQDLRRLLPYGWYHKAIIPPETRVDPSSFSEEEFPVYCPRCSYLLTGLAASRCPECGREFDRGRLLVEQYLLKQAPPTNTADRMDRVAAWIPFGSMVLFVLLMSFGRVFAASFSWLIYVLLLLLLFLNLGGLGLLLACARAKQRDMRSHALDREKQERQVFAALDWSDPVFRRAQRLRWVGLAVYCIAFALLVIILMIGADRYSPWATVVAVVVFGGTVVWSVTEFRRCGPGANG
ncbi:MAG TPA: hypothetical protein PLQ89_11410 [Phycisphaerae bacterium]|nr:hypothetical protein [Phycisphaerae bacterium]HOQ86315.1 hypothetical protein [Phycisphaerae bacterium]